MSAARWARGRILAALAFLAWLDDRLLSAREGLLATPLLPTLLAFVVGGFVSAALAVMASRQTSQAGR